MTTKEILYGLYDSAVIAPLTEEQNTLMQKCAEQLIADLALKEPAKTP